MGDLVIKFFYHFLIHLNDPYKVLRNTLGHYITDFQSLTVINFSYCFAHCSLFFLYWGRRTGFLAAILPLSPASINCLFTVVTNIGSSQELFIIFVNSGALSTLFLLLVVAIILSSAEVALLHPDCFRFTTLRFTTLPVSSLFFIIFYAVVVEDLYDYL